MSSLITLTMNPTLDIGLRVDQIIPNRKLRANNYRKEPGGGGINVSRVLKRLGAEPLTIYPLGGSNGGVLDSLLKKEKIKTLPVHISESIRENYIIAEQNSSNQFRFGAPGPQLETQEWKNCLDVVDEHLEKGSYIIASGSLPPGVPENFFAQVAEKARDRGAFCIIDTSGRALKKAAQAGAYLLKPNLSELADLVEGEIGDERWQELAAREIINGGGCEIIIVSQGSGGALLVSSGEVIRLRAPSVPIVSRVGAGDSMVAGLVWALYSGYSLREALRFGIVAGTAAVMTPGSELAYKSDIEKIYEQMKRNP